MIIRAVLFLFFMTTNIATSFAVDPILLNCIETPKILKLDDKPTQFSLSNNLRRKTGSPENIAGELIHIVGRVTDASCLPVQNAVVFMWHKGKQIDNLSGKFITDNLGYYHFITIMPDIHTGQAPYINFIVQHPDFLKFTTQMFFADYNDKNCNDPVLKDFLENGLASLLIAPVSYRKQNVKTYTFNITLEGYNKYIAKR
uniref:dioxygenase family protein n=1 Tax=Wolbachia endosymbiont of Pentidionis agamae TaxID=3110435 RepID=UPI002FD05E34